MIRTGNEKLDPKTLVLPVAAGAAITEATMVALGADGYAVPASKAANLTVAGVALEPADNRTGEAGDIWVKVRRGAFVMGHPRDLRTHDPGRGRRQHEHAPRLGRRHLRRRLLL